VVSNHSQHGPILWLQNLLTLLGQVFLPKRLSVDLWGGMPRKKARLPHKKKASSFPSEIYVIIEGIHSCYGQFESIIAMPSLPPLVGSPCVIPLIETFHWNNFQATTYLFERRDSLFRNISGKVVSLKFLLPAHILASKVDNQGQVCSQNHRLGSTYSIFPNTI